MTQKSPIEQTLVVLKPDAVRRHLVGTVIGRFEAKGYRLERLELRSPQPDLLEEHYSEHRGKSYFPGVIDYMTSGALVAAILSGERVIEGVRSIVGATDPTVAAPGSIRGDFGRSWVSAAMENIIHASDSLVSAQREISLWFPEHPTIDPRSD